MKVHVEDIPASSIVYMRRTVAYGEQNYKLMQDMKAWIQRQNLWGNDGVIYGIAQDNAAFTPPEQCRYDICFVSDQTFDDPVIHHGAIPPGTYLVFEIPHTAEAVEGFWASVRDMVVIEGKRIDENRPILERYQFVLVENGYCEFCIPILK